MASVPSEFVQFGNDIWLVKADKEQNGVDYSQPTLILIFGWMDAKPAHVAKFSAGYRKLFPSANQLVFGSSTWSCFFRGSSGVMQDMQPALDYLISQDVLGNHARPHRILTHAMSNGGCIRLDQLAKLISTTPNHTTSSLTKSAMVIDSAPGGDDIQSALTAFQAMIPSPFLRYPTIAAVFSMYTLTALLGITPWSIFEPIRQGILNPKWLPWINSPSGQVQATPWLFVYSKNDRTVPFKDTHKLTQVAESHDMDIRRDIYEDSHHVGHMRADPSRYWAAVKALWEDVTKTD